MRTSTRLGICTAVGSFVLLFAGCTTHVHQHPHSRHKPLPHGHAKKHETHVYHNRPPGLAKKSPAYGPQQPPRPVQVRPVHPVTNVQVVVQDGDQAQPLAQPAFVPPGQLKKEQNYGHQDKQHVPPGLAKKQDQLPPGQAKQQQANESLHVQVQHQNDAPVVKIKSDDNGKSEKNDAKYDKSPRSEKTEKDDHAKQRAVSTDTAKRAEKSSNEQSAARGKDKKQEQRADEQKQNQPEEHEEKEASSDKPTKRGKK